MKECSHGVPINEWCDECIKATREHNDRLDDIYAGRLQDLESRLEEVGASFRSPGCYPYDGDSLLRGFAAFYELDGDLIRCKSCGRACIASRSGEDFVHAAYCENAAHLQPNPWVHLREILNDHVDG